MPIVKKKVNLMKKKLPLAKKGAVGKLEQYVLQRFDVNYLADFRRVYKRNPKEAMQLLKSWEEF